MATAVLYPGAHWGEQALVGEFPHACTVRTLERCVLLVLRRSQVQQHLPQLPVTARHAWRLEEARTHAAHEAATRLWRRRTLKRIPLLRRAPPVLINSLERATGYRLVPASAPILQQGYAGDTAFLLVLGEVDVYEQPPRDPGASELPAPRLLRRISAHSDVPLVGAEVLLSPLGTLLPFSVVTRTPCQL
eukprot:3519813-Prymnesium_polylepis.1